MPPANKWRREKSSRGAKASQVLVEFDDHRASTRLAFHSDEQDRARKFIENAAAAPAHFADDKGSIRPEANHELKRRKIANICHGELFLCCTCCWARPKIVATLLIVQQFEPSVDVAAVTMREEKQQKPGLCAGLLCAARPCRRRHQIKFSDAAAPPFQPASWRPSECRRRNRLEPPRGYLRIRGRPSLCRSGF